jgi:hypothetical protein
MTTDPEHLTAAAAQLLSEPNANRMRAVLAERWVHYLSMPVKMSSKVPVEISSLC